MSINFTIFTIVYNNYGQYLDKWLYCVKKQTLQPKEILVVLGKNHGVDQSKYENVRFIEYDSDVMGTLRNVAIKNKRYKKCLYFSVDDELYPDAISRIEVKFHQGYTVVGLRYNDLMQAGIKESNGKLSPMYVSMKRESYIIDGDDKASNWRKSGVPGYVAVNGTVEYEDIDIPNYPYIFKLKSLGMPMAHTDVEVANYVRHKGSHGDRADKTHIFESYVKDIDKWVKHYDNRT